MPVIPEDLGLKLRFRIIPTSGFGASVWMLRCGGGWDFVVILCIILFELFD